MPDWNAVTGVGTVAVAISAVGIAVWSDWQERRRMKAEWGRSEQKLAEERERSDTALAEERRLVQQREQFAEAFLVEVVLAAQGQGMNFGSPAQQGLKLKLTVRNHGHYAITGITAWAVYQLPDKWHMQALSQPKQEQRWDAFNPGSQYVEPVPGAHPDWLPPWDARLIYDVDPSIERESENENPVPFGLVRWTDRWGTYWEHRHGELRKINNPSEFTFDDSWQVS